MKRLLVFALLAFAAPAAAQVSEVGAELDAVYAQFTAGYLAADSDAVANLYAEDALYLAPGADVVRGRAAIREEFERFLGRFEDGAGPTIAFEVVDRNVDGDLATDVGYFSIGRPGAVLQRGGKYVVVWKRDADGAWRIHVDGYSDLPGEDD